MNNSSQKEGEFHDELEVPESSAQALFAKSGNKSHNFEYDSHRGNAKNPFTKNDPRSCSFCGKHPYANRCRGYATLEQRVRRAEELGLCKICLKSHAPRECRAKNTPCYYCQRKGHHQALCRQKFAEPEETEVVSEEPEESHAQVTTTMGFQNRATEPPPTVNSTAIFQLANACLISGNSSHIGTVLLDSGSDRCYITEKVRRASI